MHTPQDAVFGSDLLTDEGLSPSIIERLQGEPSLAVSFFSGLDIEPLREAGRICAQHSWSGLLQQAVSERLDASARQDWARGDKAAAISSFEVLVQIFPHDLGRAMDLGRASNTMGCHGRTVELLDCFTPFIVDHAVGEAASILFTASYRTGRFDLVTKLRDFTVHKHQAFSAIERLELIEQAGLSAIFSVEPSSAFQKAMREAMLGLNEAEILNALKAADAAGFDGDKEAVALRLTLLIAAVSRRRFWGRSYRSALALAVTCLLGRNAPDDIGKLWASAGLPAEALQAFLVTAIASAKATGAAKLQSLVELDDWTQARREAGLVEEDEQFTYSAALEHFRISPSFDRAARVWTLAYVSGRFAELVQAGPISSDPEAPGERARALRIAPVPCGRRAPLWVSMSWQKGADRLLQLLAAYAGDAKVVVTVGGDSQPEGFARATAALLCHDVHFLCRPVVCWGGQRGWLHNLVEVMTSFRGQAEPNAWLQLVCDRTYPLKSLRQLACATAAGEIYNSGPVTPSWRREWPEEVVANLPVIYDRAMDEAFQTGSPKAFVELATHPLLFGQQTFRLDASMWNYSAKALRVDWDPRTTWHNYMIAPFAADVRWMSFARLQELVDVTTESMSSFSRRLHPSVLRWAYRVLMKYELRTGDPYLYVSRTFVERVLDHPGFDEFFSVMNMGFAPEMNFLDTWAASLPLMSEVSHHFQMGPEFASDELQAEIYAGADEYERAFTRRTDPDRSRELLAFLSQRLFEERAGQGLHWIAVAGDFADDREEPRAAIDRELLERFIGSPVNVRNLIGSRVVQGRFELGMIVAADDGRTIATWSLSNGVLTVDHLDPPLGAKSYERGGGDSQVLTFVPAELVSEHNAWSAFLDFPLDGMRADADAARFGSDRAMTVLSTPSNWIGAPNAEAAILAAFADTNRSSTPTPTITASGGVFELREVDGAVLALCSIDGFPGCFEVAGFAETRRRTAVHFKPASVEQARRACDSPKANVTGFLTRSEIPGTWSLFIFEGSQTVVLTEDNWILGAEREKLGRWFLREEGLQLLGLMPLRLALGDHLRLEGKDWRIAGWGWRDLKDAVTFSMVKAA